MKILIADLKEGDNILINGVYKKVMAINLLNEPSALIAIVSDKRTASGYKRFFYQSNESVTIKLYK